MRLRQNFGLLPMIRIARPSDSAVNAMPSPESVSPKGKDAVQKDLTLNTLPTQPVIGFPVSILPFKAQVDTIIGWAHLRMSRIVCVSNVHMLMEGRWNADFAQVLREADMLTPDGMPLVWMTSRMSKQPQERVAGMELMRALCEQAMATGISIFFVGSTDEILLEIRRRLLQEFPNLQIAGMVSPPFRPLTPEEDDALVRQINNSKAGLVFLSLGCPKQERWMYQHKGKVQATMIGLGGAFGVYAGVQRWAPEWVRQNGLEWLYRLMQEPGRLWKRYTETIPPFIWLAFKQLVKVRMGFTPETSIKKILRKYGVSSGKL